MKRSTKTLLVYGAIGAVVALVLYDNRAIPGVPSAEGLQRNLIAFGYLPITAQPELTNLNIPAPANGKLAVILPAGSLRWVAAVRGTSLNTSPVQLDLPAGAAPLLVSNMAPGQAVAISWIDGNGVQQAAALGFVAPSPVSGIGLLAGLEWHPLMRPG